MFQSQICVSRSSTQSIAIDVVLSVDRIEGPVVLEHRSHHETEESLPRGRTVGDQLRDRFAVLRHDVFDARLAHAIHQSEAFRLELGRGEAQRLSVRIPRSLRARLSCRPGHDQNIMTSFSTKASRPRVQAGLGLRTSDFELLTSDFYRPRPAAQLTMTVMGN